MASSPTATIPQFINRLNFGQHKLPLDTAQSFHIYPMSDFSFPPKQYYNLIIRFTTYRNKEPFSSGIYDLHVDTLEKAEKLMKTLLSYNVKWTLYLQLQGVQASLQNRTIDLLFKQGNWQGTQVEGEQNIRMHWGDVFLLFQKAMGLSSDVYKAEIVNFENAESAVRLTFNEGPNLQSNMDETLLRLNSLSSEGEIAAFLKGNQHFHLPGKPEEKKGSVQGNQKAHKEEICSTNFLIPRFEITENSITSRDHTLSGDHMWTEKDIPYLIANHEKAPE